MNGLFRGGRSAAKQLTMGIDTVLSHVYNDFNIHLIATCGRAILPSAGHVDFFFIPSQCVMVFEATVWGSR